MHIGTLIIHRFIDHNIDDIIVTADGLVSSSFMMHVFIPGVSKWINPFVTETDILG